MENPGPDSLYIPPPGQPIPGKTLADLIRLLGQVTGRLIVEPEGTAARLVGDLLGVLVATVCRDAKENPGDDRHLLSLWDAVTDWLLTQTTADGSGLTCGDLADPTRN